jgi:uncharacterized protein (TIGR02680 family)
MTVENTGAADMGQAWLAAATGGGLPEPGRSRWQPLRVGIVNLWEYDNAEFWFADGRLVLRGGNGAGKTKVLELTTLMLLRGEITPSVLDPFGSQHRTMRFNLLPTGEGDDPREPADSGLGYAWVEFGRREDTGEPRFLTCGMGASARRGTGTGGVTTWHFVTALRPGKDFSLISGGRAVEQKDLRKIDGVTVPGSAAAYRARLSSELFGLSGESYDNLTELLKQLRKPKLGERLNPTSLAETLREALPPLATHEVTQLAEGWDHLEQLRRAVEQTEQAATAVAQFVSTGWRPWARVVLRRRADDLATATTTLDNTTREKNKAQKSLEAARGEVAAAEAELDRSRREQRDRGTELRELLDSRSYQDAVSAAVRVESLRREVAALVRQHREAEARLGRERSALADAVTRTERARRAAVEAESRVTAASAELATAATPAGLDDSVRRHLPVHDIDALSADHAGRMERFARLRTLRTEHDKAERQAEKSALAVERAQTALTTARDEESAARSAMERNVEALRELIRDWAGAASVAHCPAAQAENWCDLAVELIAIDPEAGTARLGAPVTEAMRAHVQAARDALVARAEKARLRRAPLAARRGAVDAELAEVRARTETAPPAPMTWRRRERPGPDAELGAPLWRLVNPADGVDGERLARLEAALAGSGLLDAWITPDGTISTVDNVLVADVQPRPGDARTGDSLLRMLVPQRYGGVETGVVRRLLGAVGWFEVSRSDEPGDWLAADGGWRVGGLTGRAEPAAPASYLGAAAREAARQREIERLEAEATALDSALAELDRELAGIAETLTRLDGEERAIPVAAERDVTAAAVMLAERARRRLGCVAELSTEERRHGEDLTRRDEAWARFADYAGTHRFGLRDLDGQADALNEYRAALSRLDGELGLLAARQDALDAAKAQLGAREQARDTAADEVFALDDQLRQARVRLATAEAALGTDQRDQLRRRDELDAEVSRLGTLIDELNTRLTGAKVAAMHAEDVLGDYERRRAEAESARDTAMAALWAAVDGGLAEPLGLAPPERRSVQAARELAAAARRELTVDARPADEERAWRRCYQRLEGLRQSLLPNRDARVLDDEAASGLHQVVVLADPARGWQPPHRAADGLAGRVAEQRDSYDAEQQRVLTTLLGSAFIEHLKDRLDYMARTFANINDQLSRHPTRHGNAVRVVWEADPTDPDASAVVTALARGYHELSTERQDMVRSFLARKIDEARGDAAADGAADWKEQLARALDYRGWLRLSLQYRPGGGSPWTVFDAARHAAKSGGEKVVLLSQPLFAAAVVAYDAAGPHAPRWVWLDEAMTGVDATVKASFMGLTVDFALDVMLTAHDEWCNYPTVPAVAVYDLARQPHVPGVDAMPYLWSGGTLTAVEAGQLAAMSAAPRIPAEGLFAKLDQVGPGSGGE